MAIVVRYPTSELTAESYNGVNKALTEEIGSDAPEGLEVHVCFGEDGDLKISEIVDAPNWIVSAFLPESIFL